MYYITKHKRKIRKTVPQWNLNTVLPFYHICIFMKPPLQYTIKIQNYFITIEISIMLPLYCHAQSPSVQFSCSVVSDSLQAHGLQHARFPCPSPTLWACSNSCPLSRWCHPTVSSSVVPFSSPLQFFPEIRVFPSELVLCIRWPKYWSFSFSISPSNGYSGLISLRIDWLDFPEVQGTLNSLLQYHSSKASILPHSAFFIFQLSHPYMTTGKSIALTRPIFIDKAMSLFLICCLGWS